MPIAEQRGGGMAVGIRSGIDEAGVAVAGHRGGAVGVTKALLAMTGGNAGGVPQMAMAGRGWGERAPGERGPGAQARGVVVVVVVVILRLVLAGVMTAIQLPAQGGTGAGVRSGAARARGRGGRTLLRPCELREV